MKFTAEDVYLAAARQSRQLRRSALDPETVALEFNQTIDELLIDICHYDDERLLTTVTLDALVVAADPIDLTASDVAGVVTTGQREWLKISYIDFNADEEEDDDEVWLTTFEARNRALNDHHGRVIGYLEDQQRKLRKVDGWDNINTIEVHGILAPKDVTADTLGSEQFDYPAALFAALRWELLVRLADMIDGLNPADVARWAARADRTYDALVNDVSMHASSRIEDIPFAYEV